MASILNTKKALERKLSQILPSVPIAFENVKFIAPVDELYIRTQFIINQPEDPTISDRYYRERFTFQVFVCDLLNIGTSSAFQTAEIIRSEFDKGFYINENGTNIHILNTPQIAGSTVVGDRIIVPVLIEVVSEVYKA